MRAWRYIIRGVSGHEVPVLLLDTAVPENTPWDQTLTDYLYGGDSHYRLCQEVVLGMGGAAILRALGYNGEVHYHLNEGHSALLTLCLLEWQLDVVDLASCDARQDFCHLLTREFVRRYVHAPVDELLAILRRKCSVESPLKPNRRRWFSTEPTTAH